MSGATIIPGSAGVRSPELNLFKVPPTDISITSRKKVLINPFNTGINPVDFQIDPQSGFVDLNQSYFELELRLVKRDGTPLTAVADSTILPANNGAHTLIRQVNMRLNNTLMSPQTDTYHYKAFIDNVLNYDRKDGEDILAAEGWYNGLDPPAALTADELDLTHADFLALPLKDQKTVRKMKAEYATLVGQPKIYRFKPRVEAFYLSKLLVPGVQMAFQFYFNDPALFMIRYVGADALRLTQADLRMRFVMCQVQLNISIERELLLKQERGVVSYPTVRSEIRTYNLPADERVRELDNPFQGRIPNLLIVGLVSANSFNGTAGTNPFRFQKFNLHSIKQMIRGEEYPYETLELVHNASSLDIRGYHRWLEATQCLRKGKGNMLRPDEWGEGHACTLFAFDNAANGFLHSAVLNPRLHGELRLVLNFGANPGENIVALLYAEFENLLEVDRNKAVLYNVYQERNQG